MFPKELGSDMLPCRLTGQCLDAVLAEFEDVPVIVGARPGAALAIEPIFLVHLQPGADATRETGLTESKFQALRQRGHSRRHAMRLTQRSASRFLRRLCAGSRRQIFQMRISARSARRSAV